MVKTEPRQLDKRGRGTQRTITTTKLCPNKKLPSGAPKTRVIRIMDTVKGALKQVLQYVRAHELAELTRLGRWPRGVKQCWLLCAHGPGSTATETPPGGDSSASAR